MKNGIRVITVMNRKGGCGKSTLIRGLASAAADRGETVTVFDTDGSRGLWKWMERAKAANAWSEDVEVIATLDARQVERLVEAIFEQPDQEHLVLIDTFGGGADPAAQDLLADLSDLVVSPCMLSAEDLEETRETALWYALLKQRVADPATLPPYRVIASRVPAALREPDRAVLQSIARTLPLLDQFVANRSVYSRMSSGLLGPVRDNLLNRGVASHVQDGLDEMTEALDALDSIIRQAA